MGDVIDPELHAAEAQVDYMKSLQDTSEQARKRRRSKAMFHATMATAGFLAQMEICGHGVRGFCPHCVRNGGFSS